MFSCIFDQVAYVLTNRPDSFGMYMYVCTLSIKCNGSKCNFAMVDCGNASYNSREAYED